MSRLFVFEGPDGVGKTTIVEAARERLGRTGIRCTTFAFPGNEPGSLGRRVYELHMAETAHTRATGEQLSPVSLQLLHIAAHVDAIEKRIRPALEAGLIVLLDRYWWSTLVYGRLAGVAAAQLQAMLQIERHAWQGVVPAAVFLVQRSTSCERPDLVRTYAAVAREEASSCRAIGLDNNGPLNETVRHVVEVIRATHDSERAGASRTRRKGARTRGRANPGNREAAPLVFSRLEPAQPSRVYDTYWKFAAERQAMFFRRVGGMAGSLTSDPILARYKFTNAYRASDRVSQFLIRNILYSGDQRAEEVFFRAILFKLFNRIETWALLSEALAVVTCAEFRFDRYDEVLTRALAFGRRIYSAAYIMPTAGRAAGEERKHRSHLRLLQRMLAEGVPNRIAEACSLRQTFEILRSYPMLGDFLAYQFAIDLNYSTLTNFSEMEFIMPGPGARDGLRKCFASTGGLSEADIVRLVTDRQEAEFERLGLPFKPLWGRRLQLVDCQNLFCEVDKYARLAHPEVIVAGGRTRIKQTYRPNAAPIEYWYPPKWGLNEAVAATLTVARRSELTVP